MENLSGENLNVDPNGQSTQTPTNEGQTAPDGQAENDWKRSYDEYRSFSDRKINELNQKLQQLESQKKEVSQVDPIANLSERYGVDKTYLTANAEVATYIADKRAEEISERKMQALEQKIRRDMELANAKNSIPDYDKMEPVIRRLDQEMTPATYMRLLAEEAKRRMGSTKAPVVNKPPVVEGSGKTAQVQSYDPNKMSFQEMDNLMRQINPDTGKRYMDSF